MHCLVLGANGFIGKHLVEQLLINDNQITVFDKKIDKTNNKNVKVIQGEFSKYYDFNSLLNKVDIVFHLISTTLPNSEKDLSDEIDENVIATLKLLDACVANKIKKLCFISSGGTVYGESKGIPFVETDTTMPICSYGIQKLAIEKFLHLYYHKYNLDYSVIRLANPYGPGQNPKGYVGAICVFLDKVINHETVLIYGDGSSVRDYIYIDDAIEGILNIANYNGKEKVFNLGSGIGTSLSEIIGLIEELIHAKVKVKYFPKRISDLEYSVLDTTLYNNLFPKHEFIDLVKGIKNMKLYLENIGADNEF